MVKILLTIALFLFANISFAGDGHSHKHQMLEANSPYPTLDVEIIKDAKDGYNLIIHTSNFHFAPENVNLANNGNEGHAHIYINNTKFRQYSPYFHLSTNLLKNGENEITVTLNSNDHSHFMADGMPLTFEIKLKADGTHAMTKGHTHKNH